MKAKKVNDIFKPKDLASVDANFDELIRLSRDNEIPLFDGMPLIIEIYQRAKKDSRFKKLYEIKYSQSVITGLGPVGVADMLFEYGYKRYVLRQYVDDVGEIFDGNWVVPSYFSGFGTEGRPLWQYKSYSWEELIDNLNEDNKKEEH